MRMDGIAPGRRPAVPVVPAGPAAAAPDSAAPQRGAATGVAPDASRALRRWILGACCAVAFARMVDPKLWQMGLDIPDTAFGAGWQGYRIFSTVTSLLLVACMLLGGLLGDLFGRRRILLGGALVSTVACVLAAVAPGVPWFVVARSFEVGAGALALPLTLAVIRLTFQGRQRPVALLIYTTITGGALLVALLAIVIEQYVGWRATLVLPAISGVAGVYLTWRYVPESRAEVRVLRRAATAAAWALILLPLTLGIFAARLSGGWGNPISLTAIGLSLVGLVVLGISWRGRMRHGVADGLGQRRRHLLSVMLLTQAILSFGLTGLALQFYGFFSAVQRYGAIVAGLALLPLLVGVVLTARPATRWAMRMDARHLIGGGLVLMATSLIVSALVRPAMPYWPVILPLIVFGGGYLVAQTAWLTVFMNAMPDDVVGASAAITKATGATGAALGGALLGTVLLNVAQADFARRLVAQGLSAAQIAEVTAALNAVLLADAASDRSLPPPSIQQAGVLAAYYDSYTVGVAAALLLAGVLCLLTAALVWLILEPHPAGRPAGIAPADDLAGLT